MNLPKKTKILFVQPNAKLGGSFQSLYFLLQNLDKSRYEAAVLLPDYNHLPVERLKSVCSEILIYKFPPIAISINFKYRLIIIDLIRFYIFKNYYLRRIPKLKADIIHLNSLNSVFGLLLAKQMKIPVVWHIREQIPRCLGGYLRRYLLKYINDPIVKYLICISENEAKHLPANKVKVIHNFYQLKQQPFPDTKPIKFLSVGSFTQDKGFWLFIEAVRYLSKWFKPSDFKVALLGIPSNYNVTKRLLREKTIYHFKTEINKHQIDEFFEFYPQRQEIIPEFFATFHVLVRPSLHKDPWGRDIIEAMSTGRALIATGNYIKFVRPTKNGYLISAPDPIKLANKMKLFIEDRQLAIQFGQNSFKIAEEMFNPKKNSKKIEKIYKDISFHS